LSSVGFPLVPSRVYWNCHIFSKMKIRIDQLLDKIPPFRGKGTAMILVIEKKEEMQNS